MTTTTFTKVMSVDSASGAPTPPHPTPATDTLEQAQSGNETDLTAVSKTLEPIQEDLNEAADYAMFPSPPINTPEAFSPAPSIIIRQHQRGCGLSAVGDRLAQLSIGERVLYGKRDHDGDSSTHSVAHSLDEERDGSYGRIDTPLFSPTGSIPIALGSPAVNPRINDFLSFQAAGDGAPAKGSGEKGKSGGGGGSESVTEKTNWEDEVVADVERALKRLEQLADDEGVTKPAKPAKQHYVELLQKVLDGADRKYPVTLKKTE